MGEREFWNEDLKVSNDYFIDDNNDLIKSSQWNRI